VDLALQNFFETKIKKTNEYIDKNRPWKLQGEKLNVVLTKLVGEIREIAFNLEPFIPESALKIKEQFKGTKIKAESPLFPRIS
jgi:methionyl-tRNA synthetase